MVILWQTFKVVNLWLFLWQNKKILKNKNITPTAAPTGLGRAVMWARCRGGRGGHNGGPRRRPGNHTNGSPRRWPHREDAGGEIATGGGQRGSRHRRGDAELASTMAPGGGRAARWGGSQVATRRGGHTGRTRRGRGDRRWAEGRPAAGEKGRSRAATGARRAGCPHGEAATRGGLGGAVAAAGEKRGGWRTEGQKGAGHMCRRLAH